MGDAKLRGNHASRREQAIERMLDEAEVIITLAEKNGGINLCVLPRDEAPNGQSLAVILASFIDSNLPALVKAAVAAKLQSEQPETAANEIAMRPVRSITSVDGGLAKDEPAILGPDGRALQ